MNSAISVTMRVCLISCAILTNTSWIAMMCPVKHVLNVTDFSIGCGYVTFCNIVARIQRLLWKLTAAHPSWSAVFPFFNPLLEKSETYCGFILPSSSPCVMLFLPSFICSSPRHNLPGLYIMTNCGLPRHKKRGRKATHITLIFGHNWLNCGLAVTCELHRWVRLCFKWIRRPKSSLRVTDSSTQNQKSCINSHTQG